MSENEQLVRRVLEAFMGGDLDTLIASAHPEGEIVPLRAAIEDTSYHGIEGLRQFWSDTEEVWRQINLDVEQVRDLGDGRVLVLGRLSTIGRESATPVEQEVGFLFTVEDGKLRRVVSYQTPAEALDAAGLSEAS